MKSNLFQAYTKIDAPEYQSDVKYNFMYGRNACFTEKEDTELLTVDDYEKDFIIFDQEFDEEEWLF